MKLLSSAAAYFRAGIRPDEGLRDLIPESVARSHGIVCLGFNAETQTLTVAVAEESFREAESAMERFRTTEPFNERLVGRAGSRLFMVRWERRSREEINRALESLYRERTELVVPNMEIAHCIPFEVASTNKIILEKIIGHKVYAICVNTNGENYLVGLVEHDRQMKEKIAAAGKVDFHSAQKLQLHQPVRRVTQQILEELLATTYPREINRGTGKHRASVLVREVENQVQSLKSRTERESSEKKTELTKFDEIIRHYVALGYGAGAADVRFFYDFSREGLVVDLVINNREVEAVFEPMSNELFDQLLTILIRKCEQSAGNEGLKNICHSGLIEFKDIVLPDKTTKVDLTVRLETTPISAEKKGEVNMSACLRLQTGGDKILRLDQLGYLDHELRIILELANKKNGLIVLSGPTGSGKTGTILAIVLYVHKKKKGHRVFTIENPIEVRLPGPGIFQTEVTEKMSATQLLKSIMRQSVDAIISTEVRDAPGASATIEAAKTGHIVFTTTHATTAFHVPSRLLGFGTSEHPVNAMDIGDTLAGVVSQSLAELICEHCKVDDTNWKERLAANEGHGSKLTNLLIALRHWKIPTNLDEAYEFAAIRQGKLKWNTYGRSLKAEILREAKKGLEDEPLPDTIDRVIQELGIKELGSYDEWVQKEGREAYVFRPAFGCGEKNGRACPMCRSLDGEPMGNKGRTAIPEIWDPEPFKAMISDNVPASVLHRAAMKRGHITQHLAGIQRVLAQKISLESYFNACGAIQLGYEGVPGFEFSLAEMTQQIDDHADLAELVYKESQPIPSIQFEQGADRVKPQGGKFKGAPIFEVEASAVEQGGNNILEVVEER
jgi:flagellar biosynthesis GTPase FlhF